MTVTITEAGDYRVGSSIVRLEAGQVCSAPAGTEVELITYYDEYQDLILQTPDSDRAPVGDTKNGKINKLDANPFSPDTRPETFVTGTEEVTPWVYDADTPLQVIAGMLYSYLGTTYICRQYHIANSPTFAPSPDTLALFTVVPDDEFVWQAGVSYKLNSVVEYETLNYRCIQAHVSQVGWEPPNVPSLWELI